MFKNILFLAKTEKNNLIYKFSFKNYNNIINQIKKYLIEENGEESWNDFQENMGMGSCQYIALSVDMWAKKHGYASDIIMGDIDFDESVYILEDDEMSDGGIHHWNKIEGIEMDFAKGSLKNYIKNLGDLNDPTDIPYL